MGLLDKEMKELIETIKMEDKKFNIWECYNGRKNKK
jgi:hypothetical protein